MKKVWLLSAVLICFIFVSASLTGCSKYKTVSTSVEGELNFMSWGGTATYIEDIGHKNYGETDLAGASAEAQIYAVAKAFNEIYPNIKINVFAKVGAESDENGSWAQHRENFKTEYGTYPDIFATKDLVEDMNRGVAADLSVFKDDPIYKTLNPTLMQAMNYKGVQAAFPSVIPWGVFVNRSLAEANNLDVPPVNWTFDDYTAFVNSADNTTFYGAVNTPTGFVDPATKDLTYQLMNRKDGEDYFKVNSLAVRELLAYVPKWANSAINPLYAQGKITDAFMEENWSWSHAFFYNNKVLTNDYDPWMMGDSNLSKVADWDIYPIPAAKAGEKNSASICLDAVVVYNYALDDGDPALSDAEYEKMKIAYEFTKFYVADSRAKQALVDTKFAVAETGELVSSQGDNLPIVTGEEFDKQMDIWFQSATHQVLKDPAKKPGFAEVLKIFKSGEVYGSMSIPQSYSVEGQTMSVYNDWWNLTAEAFAGAKVSDPNWLDNIYAKLPAMQDDFNKNFALAEKDLKENLKKFYGKTDEDLK